MLNAKQEMFVQNLIKGMSQREAYKKAYNATYDPKAIDSKACNLFNSDKIQERYKELIEEVKDEAIMTAIERRKWLTNVINGKELEKVEVTLADGQKELVGSKEADLNMKMKAMDMLNKMDGEYISNHKISGDQDNPVHIVDLSHLSTEEIRELLKDEH